MKVKPRYWSQVGHDLRRPRTFAPPIVAFLVLAVVLEPGWGTSGALLVSVLVVWDVLLNARRRSRDAFFEDYALSRGLSQSDVELPELTPLLTGGDTRYADRVMLGTLPGGFDGVLAHHTYVRRLREDAQGDWRGDRVCFTVVFGETSDPLAKVSLLCCEPRSASRLPHLARGAPMRRLGLESVQADRRYQVFFDPATDELWARRLFAPSFIVWLAEQPLTSFGFELCDGVLCAYVIGHVEHAAVLDALCEAAATVAHRLGAEAAADLDPAARPG